MHSSDKRIASLARLLTEYSANFCIAWIAALAKRDFDYCSCKRVGAVMLMNPTNAVKQNEILFSGLHNNSVNVASVCCKPNDTEKFFRLLCAQAHVQRIIRKEFTLNVSIVANRFSVKRHEEMIKLIFWLTVKHYLFLQ